MAMLGDLTQWVDTEKRSLLQEVLRLQRIIYTIVIQEGGEYRVRESLLTLISGSADACLETFVDAVERELVLRAKKRED